jgi:hypothetical protein
VRRTAAVLAAGAVAAALMGCADILDVTPVNSPSTSNFYQNDKQLDQATAAAYSSLNNAALYKGKYQIDRDVLADDASTDEGSYQGRLTYTYSTDDDILATMWDGFYQCINRANIVLYYAPKAPNATAAKVKEVSGQARFLRALSYWHLVTMWGRVPIVWEDVESPDINVTFSDIDTVWRYIEKDLTTIIENEMLPPVYTKADKGRATLASARALLGKVYLYEASGVYSTTKAPVPAKYAQAAEQFGFVLRDTATYKLSLVPELDKVWTPDNENNSEAVFELQFLRTTDLPNVYIEDQGGAAEGSMRNRYYGVKQGGNGGWNNIYPVAGIINTYAADDPRLKLWYLQHGDTLPYSDLKNQKGAVITFDSTTNNGSYGVRKGIITGIRSSAPGGFDENFPVIRLADVVLMLAECAEKAGQTTEAAALVDLIRARAYGAVFDAATHGVAALMAANGSDILTELKNERRRELAFECHRYNDLVRWGDAATALAAREWTAEKTFYPIPKLEIERSGGQVSQNSPY